MILVAEEPEDVIRKMEGYQMLLLPSQQEGL
jgi:hypothetical protein